MKMIALILFMLVAFASCQHSGMKIVQVIEDGETKEFLADSVIMRRHNEVSFVKDTKKVYIKTEGIIRVLGE